MQLSSTCTLEVAKFEELPVLMGAKLNGFSISSGRLPNRENNACKHGLYYKKVIYYSVLLGVCQRWSEEMCIFL